MPPLLRHHRATVAVAALFAGAPPLAVAAVAAEPAPPSPPGVDVPDGGRELIFEGDRRLGVRCVARSSVASMSVPAETTVRVVNRTGFRGRLLLDGVARGEIAGGASVEVLFHHGPVAVGLRPLCVFAAESAVRIEVGPPVVRPRVADAAPAAPDGEAGRDAGSGGPAPQAGPGGSAAGRVEAPVRRERQRYAWSSGLAAEPLEPVELVRDNGPTGLLALVATICVVGVVAGAIRAIIAQRATRTVVP